jgi:O-antigen/teichoic acid export membrane protein
MFKEIIKVFGETIVYGVTGVASTLASVFLVPFYTRVLTPFDYGISALIGTLFTILVVVANLGMGSAIFRSYFEARDKEREVVAGTSFISQTIFPFLISAATFLMSRSISRALFGNDDSTFLVKLSSVALFFNAGIVVPLALLRAAGKPTNYVSISLVKLFSTIAFSILLVVVLRLGLPGVFWANLFGAVLGYLMGLGYTIRRIKLVFSKYWLREMLRFGVPLIPAGLAMWVLNSSDRYFLNHFFGTADVGIYNVGYRVGSLITLVVGAVQLAYSRFVFSIYNDRNDAKYYFKKISTYFYLLIFTCALLLSVFAKEAIQILTGSAFHSAYVVVPLISLSYVAYGLYFNFGTGIYVMGKTYLSAISTALAGGTNLVFNYFLISKFGMMGAAVSTLASFLILALIQLKFSQRVYRIPFEFKRFLTVLAIGGVLIYVSTLVNFGLIASLSIKSLLVLAFPVLLYFAKFFEERELQKLLTIWAAVKSSRGNPKVFLDSMKQDLIL